MANRYTPTAIASLARSHDETAINTLAKIMTAPEAPWACRIEAAKALLDRGHGKPQQTIQSEVEHRWVVEMPPDLTHDEWIQKASTLLIESKDG